MVKNVYAMLDNKTGFMEPFLDFSDETAIRGFQFSMKNQPGIIGFSPLDFNLYQVATFDTQSGLMTPLSPLRFVYSAVSAVRGDLDEE